MLPNIPTTANALLTDATPKAQTVFILEAMDFIIKDGYINPSNIQQYIRHVLGQISNEDVAKVEQIINGWLADDNQPYRRTLTFYRIAEHAGTAMGSATLAKQLGEDFSFLSSLNNISPRTEHTQMADFLIKFGCEIMASLSLQGLPTDVQSIGNQVSHFKNETAVRMATLIAIDGLLPLGPNFVQKISDTLQNGGQNSLFSQISVDKIQPLLGNNQSVQQIWQKSVDIFNQSQQSITQFLAQKGITQASVSQQLNSVINFSADKVDYVSAYMDMTTNYIYHSGSLTVLRKMIENAYIVVQSQPKQPNIAVAHASVGVARG